MTSKLNTLAATHALVSAKGNFGAVEAYCVSYGSAGAPSATIATMNAALAGGIREFYSPVLPRGLRLNTAQEVLEADLDVQHVQISPAPNVGVPEMIVSGHAGTRKLLQQQFPSATVIEGNVSPDDITGKVVVGTLPPHLVALTGAYVPVTISSFDYSKDGDLSGEELRERLVVGSTVTVTVE